MHTRLMILLIGLALLLPSSVSAATDHPDVIKATVSGSSVTVSWGPIPSDLGYTNGMYEAFLGKRGFHNDGNPGDYKATCRTAPTVSSCTLKNIPAGSWDVVVYATSTNNQSFSSRLLSIRVGGAPQAPKTPAVGVPCSSRGKTTTSKGRYLECGANKRWRAVALGSACLISGNRAGPNVCSSTKNGFRWQRFVSSVNLPWAKCDPNDPRISAYSLPVAPREARIAAACLALEWVTNSTPNYSLKIYSSPGFSTPGLAVIRKSVEGGFRLFNRFALNPKADALVIASGDHDFSCTTGKSIIDPLVTGKSEWRGPWRDFPNSGCVTSTHVGGGYAATLGGDGSIRLGWFLANEAMVTEDPVGDGNGSGNYLWLMRGFAHELVHATQFQANGRSFAGESHSDPGWYGEGQANYLGAAVTWLAFDNAKWRSAMVADLRRWMPDDGTHIDLREIREGGRQSAWEDQLMYVAGQFATEFLIAHYGYDASWSWWRAWAGCLGDLACIDAKTPALFGLSVNEFYRQLNAYVHDQLTGNTTAFSDAACDDTAFTGLPSGNTWRPAAAAACVAEEWLDTSDDPEVTIDVLGPTTLSERTEDFIKNQARAGLRVYGQYAADPTSRITFIVPDSPSWLCTAGTNFFANSESASSWRTDSWSGCDTSKTGPHSWSSWTDGADCSRVPNMVNQPGAFSSGPRKGERWLILSQCTGFLAGTREGSASWGLRKLLQANTDTLGAGHMRYWFESGWEALYSSYGGALKAGTSLRNERPWLSEWSASLLSGGKLPSIASFDETGNGPSVGISVPLNGIMTTLAAEYVLAGWGSAATFDLINGWADSDSGTAAVTLRVLGISEDELFASIDAYIAAELALDR